MWCFGVHLYDVKTHESYQYDISLVEIPWSMMHAADGGLVCLVSVSVNQPVLITVINPISMAIRMLPCPKTIVEPKMLHLTVEPETGEYNLVLVQNDFLAEEYNSQSGQWTKYETFKTMYGFIYGWKIRDDNSTFEGIPLGLSVYKQGKLTKITIEPQQEESVVINYAFMRNCIFVLVKEVVENVAGSFIYAVSEIEPPCDSEVVGDRVEVASHSFEVPPQENYKPSLYATSGFLEVFASIGTTPHESGWLFCLATRTWSHLPRLPRPLTICADGHDLVCEIKWSATP